MYRTAFELLPQPCVIARLDDGALLAVNEAFLRMTDFTRVQVLGRSLSDLGASVRAAGESELVWQTRQGRALRLSISSTFFETDAEPCALHVLTEHAQPVRERGIEPVTQAFLDLLPVSVWVAHGLDARHVHANRAALALMRTQDPDAATRFDVYVDDSLQAPEEQPLRRAARTGSAVQDFEHELRFEDGAHVWVRGSAVPLYDAAGQRCGAIAAAVDITPLKRAEAALRDRDRRKDDFLAMLSHELRNPLAPILTALQVMQQRGDEEHAHEREVIARQAQHLTRMVDDLLDVSRITRGKLELNRELSELAPIIARALEATAPVFEQRRQQLIVNVPPRGLRVYVDELRVTQIFSNLLTNAARYTPLAGQIEVCVTRERDQVVTRVRDNGVGIEPSILASIFDLFVQGDRGRERAGTGLGLGLALVRALTRLHGGTIEAHSEGAGRGSEFVVRLPLAAQSTQRQTRAPASEPVFTSQHMRRVLIVDDNEDAADMLCTLLSAAGHELRVASDPLAALAVAECFKPEVALLDIGLPVMDGYELGRRLSERFAPAQRPVLIALTGYGQEHDRQRSQDAGFAHHLLKPVDTEALLRLLDALPTR